MIIIREPKFEDAPAFLAAMQRSQSLHHPWVKAPLVRQEFDEYFQHSQKPNQKSFLVFNQSNHIVGVFNISEIVRGLFQNAFLGFYGVADYTGKGHMSTGLKLILQKVFEELALHRLEANIQPENVRSIQLVKNNGFRYEGFSPHYLKIDGEWRGHEHWVMTYEDFISSKKMKVTDKVEIFPLNEDDIDEIVLAFKNIGWNKPRSTYEAYFKEQTQGFRSIFIAKFDGKFCGYTTIKWESDYPPFKIKNVPEISDLNVLPDFRKQGIGTLLIQNCEKTVNGRGHTVVGLGVGMTADYGNAQRLYVRLGYLPDGNGLYYKYKAVSYHDIITVNDDLVLYFTRKI